MKTYTFVFDKRALPHIEQAVNYYNSQQKDLGNQFLSFLDAKIKQLSINPKYQVRYEKVRCCL